MVALIKQIETDDKRQELTKMNTGIYKYRDHDDSSYATLATISTISSSEDDGQELLVEPRQPSRNIRQSRKQQKEQTKQRTKNGKKNRKGAFVSKATSTKHHDSPMKRRDIYFALDCEMVGVGPQGLDSALARVSIVNWDYEIVFDTFVKVDEPVSDYRTFVSGITPEQIESDSAISPSQVRTIVSSILQGKILIGHDLENDLKALGIYHPLCDRRDTATYTPFMRRQKDLRSQDNKITLCRRKLKDLVLEKLGRQIQVIGKAHSPIEDAVSAMDLYKTARHEWEMGMARQINTENQGSNDYQSTKWLPMSYEGNHLMHPVRQYIPSPYGPRIAQSNHHSYPSQYYVTTQARLYAARIAQEHARIRSATVAQQQKMLILQQCAHNGSIGRE